MAGNAGALSREAEPTLNAGAGARVPSIEEPDYPRLKLTHEQNKSGGAWRERIPCVF